MRAKKLRSRRGAILVLVAILLPVMLILSAVAINFAYMDLCQTELFTATDAAARATSRELSVTRSQSSAILRGKAIAALNSVGGNSLTLADSDFRFGRSARAASNSRYAFDAGHSTKNAVEINARRTAGSLDGPIALFMPNVLGRGTVELTKSAVATSIDVDVALVLDRSGSMAFAVDEIADPMAIPASAPPGWVFGWPAPPICRWRNLLDAVQVFTSELSSSPMDELVSISTYNHIATTDLSLTNNYSLVSTALAPYTASLPMGATNIGGGINEGVGALLYSPMARPHAAKVIVLMTDGIHNYGTDPYWPAQLAANAGITIHTVTFANEADIPRMQEIAAVGGGKHFHASSAADLSAAFHDIARSLPTLLTQ